MPVFDKLTVRWNIWQTLDYEEQQLIMLHRKETFFLQFSDDF
jgi:hypothetical protein